MKGICELIDTLWNVNLRQPKRFNETLFELIDTLWNVNRLALGDYTQPLL